MPATTIDDARLVKDLTKQKLANVPGVKVVGVGLTRKEGQYAVKVNLNRSAPPGAIPEKLNGVTIIVEVVGAIATK